MRDTRLVVREGPLFALAAAASFVFLFHGMLYFDGRPPPEFRIEPFLFVTGLSYLFLRSVILAIEMRRPRVHAGRIRCPNCGQWIDDSSSGVEARGRSNLLPKRTQKQFAPTVELRNAVDVVRLGTGAHDMAGLPAVRREAENRVGRDPVAGPNDPDFLERARHGPPTPPERRIRR
jgi:hypothetical protein